jgi:energy-coupling factor transport system ATP-binding protein
MSDFVIEVKDLSYTYPATKTPVLKNINLQVEKGQLLGIIGANRSGKSSLAYTLAGVIPHLYQGEFTGSVRVGGFDTHEHTVSELVRQVGLVLQHPTHQLSGARYTVFEEVAFGLENIGVAREKMQTRVENALAQVGLRDFAERSPYQLSGGQQQRLMIAAILALAPPILVLDEPTSFLDPQGTAQVFELLTKLKESGHTIVITSQRLAWLAETAERVIALAEAEIVMDSTPRDVLASPKLKEIGLRWSRFTQVGTLAKERGLWDVQTPLPVTFEQTVEGLNDANLA